MAPVHMVEKPSGAGHDDLGSSLASQSTNLWCHAHATVHRGATQPGGLSEHADLTMDLFGEFTGRRYDECTHAASRAAGEPLQDRQHERGRLAGSGLGQAQDVPA